MNYKEWFDKIKNCEDGHVEDLETIYQMFKARMMDEQSHKHPETVPMYDRDGKYLGEWNGKVESGPKYQTQKSHDT